MLCRMSSRASGAAVPEAGSPGRADIAGDGDRMVELTSAGAVRNLAAKQEWDHPRKTRERDGDQ